MIGRNHTGTDTPCREGDQHVKSELAQLGGLIVLSPSEPIEDLSGLQPLLLRWSQHLAPSAQFKDQLPFSGRSSPAEQLVKDNRGTANDKRRLQQAKREAAGSEILYVDRSVEQRKLSGLRRKHRVYPHRYSAGLCDRARPFP